MSPTSYRGASEKGRCDLRPGVPLCPPSRAEGHRQVAMGLSEQGASHPGKMGHQGVPGDSHSTPLGGLNSITISHSEHVSEACRALCYMAVGWSGPGGGGWWREWRSYSGRVTGLQMTRCPAQGVTGLGAQ